MSKENFVGKLLTVFEELKIFPVTGIPKFSNYLEFRFQKKKKERKNFIFSEYYMMDEVRLQYYYLQDTVDRTL
jgi:hypothetical protein